MICGYHIGDFEKENTNFVYHKFATHSIWKYLFYVRYLLEKGEEEFSGDEIVVWKDYNEHSVLWYPRTNPLWLFKVKKI